MMLKQSGYITAYVTFLTIISFFYLYKNNFKIIFYFSDYLIFLFFILSIFSTLINIEKSGHYLLIKSILDIRFAFFFLIIRNLFNYKILNFKTLLIITCICTVFLCIDIFIQHIYGKDLFGFEPWHGRYAGIFNDEAIAGSYIQKFSFISIPLVLLLNISNFKKIPLIGEAAFFIVDQFQKIFIMRDKKLGKVFPLDGRTHVEELERVTPLR
jgi:hypothetical protein